MSERQVEPPVQLGPAAANLVRSIWRQRALVDRPFSPAAERNRRAAE